MVQMLPPETAKREILQPTEPKLICVLSHHLLSSQSPTRALLCPFSHPQTLDVASLLSPSWYELSIILYLPSPQRVLSHLQHQMDVGVKTPGRGFIYPCAPLQTLWGSRRRKGEFPGVQGGTHSPARDQLPLPTTLRRH